MKMQFCKTTQFTAGLILAVFASLVHSRPRVLDLPSDNEFGIMSAWALQFDEEMGRNSMNLEQNIKKREITAGLNLGSEMDELEMPLLTDTIQDNFPRRARQVIQPYRDAAPREYHNW